ncbi:hypothetical protein [Pseudobacillus wudalianchiensis]|uniref:hypothetical protein n=1 Tax=Pseudobacillus wudalianchiensis TaxID=1743143 RepID=UPI00114728D2|nr:hypothetical protein [Bacillus wudalianchiensis]
MKLPLRIKHFPVKAKEFLGQIQYWIFKTDSIFMISLKDLSRHKAGTLCFFLCNNSIIVLYSILLINGRHIKRHGEGVKKMIKRYLKKMFDSDGFQVLAVFMFFGFIAIFTIYIAVTFYEGAKLFFNRAL